MEVFAGPAIVEDSSKVRFARLKLDISQCIAGLESLAKRAKASIQAQGRAAKFELHGTALSGTKPIDFHKAFAVNDASYDDLVSGILELSAIDDDRSWRSWLRYSSHFPDMYKSLHLYWDLYWNAVRVVQFSLFASGPRPALGRKAGVDFEEAVPYNLQLDITAANSDKVSSDEDWYAAEAKAKEVVACYRKFAKKVATKQQFSESGRIDLRVPKKLRIRDQFLTDLEALVPDCCSELAPIIGPPHSTHYEVHLTGDSETAKQDLRRIAQQDIVWTRIKLGYGQPDIDVTHTLNCQQDVSAFPLLSFFQNEDRQLLFQINIVHVCGEQQIEIITNDGESWLNEIAAFYDASIEIWEGPIKSRFGWYEDSSDGTLSSHKVSHARVKEWNDYYLVIDKAMHYNETGFRHSQNHFNQAFGIFEGFQEAEEFARLNLGQFFVEHDIREYTGGIEEGYDFADLPAASQQRVRELLDMKPDSDWKEELNDIWAHTLSEPVLVELVSRLEFEPFCIVQGPLLKNSNLPSSC